MAELKKVPVIYREPSNYILGDQKGDMEINDDPSETIPDQSYSIPEIMEKFTRGIDPMISRTGQYPEIEATFESDLGYIPPEFDLTDIPVETLEENLTRLKTEVKRRKAEKIEAEKKPEHSEGKLEAENK